MRGREAAAARGGAERRTGRGACPFAPSRGGVARVAVPATDLGRGSAGMSNGGASGRIVLRRGLGGTVAFFAGVDACAAALGSAGGGARFSSGRGFGSSGF